MARRVGKKRKSTPLTLQVRINTGDPTVSHMFVVNLLE